MRVIAGALKRRRLKAPTWDGLRPTGDKLRETLFNILGPRVEGARVLDLYAGTGALGIEALSRGAADIVFVDRDRRAQTLIAENLKTCGITTGYTIVGLDVQRTSRDAWRRALGDRTFDLVFLDPPYSIDHAELQEALSVAGALVQSTGIVVLEHARKTAVPDSVAPLVRTRAVPSGDSELTFYQPSC